MNFDCIIQWEYVDLKLTSVSSERTLEVCFTFRDTCTCTYIDRYTGIIVVMILFFSRVSFWRNETVWTSPSPYVFVAGFFLHRTFSPSIEQIVVFFIWKGQFFRETNKRSQIDIMIVKILFTKLMFMHRLRYDILINRYRKVWNA